MDDEVAELKIRVSEKNERIDDLSRQLAAARAENAELRKKIAKLQNFIGVMDAALKIEGRAPDR